MKKRVAFVTGGAGFIGSHLSELLMNKGWEVKILMRTGEMHPAYKDIIYPEVFEKLKKKGAKMIYGDIRNPEVFEEELKRVDVLFHAAGIAYPYFGLPEEEYFKINTFSTKRLVDLAEKKGVKKFIYFSSIEAVGPSRDGKQLTEKDPKLPTDAYGRSKKDSEEFLIQFMKSSKMKISIVRPPMTYGERSPLLSRLFQFIQKGFFPMFGRKDSSFEFCYVKNLVYGIYLIAINKCAEGELFFVSEKSHKILGVVQEISKIMNKKTKIIYVPKKLAYLGGFIMEGLNKLFPFYPFRGKETGSPYFSRKTVDWVTNDRYICAINKIKELLNYSPIYSQEEALRRTIKWYKEKRLI